MTRRMFQTDGSIPRAAAESRFDTERDLHEAFASHPEVLPSENPGFPPRRTVVPRMPVRQVR